MKNIGRLSRVIAICAMLVALANVSTRTIAQEAGDIATADEGTSSAFYSVNVACWPEGDGSQSTCSFTGQSSDGAAVEAIWVPLWIACSTVNASSGVSTGDGYFSEGSSLAMTFAGSVSAGGDASYMVRIAGTAVPASGSGVTCASPSVAEDVSGDTDTGSDDVPPVDDGNVTTGDTEATPTDDDTETVPPADPSDEGSVDGNETGADGNTTGTDGNVTGEDGNVSTGEEEPVVDPETEATPETDDDGDGNVTGPVGDGSDPTETGSPVTETANQTSGEDVSTAEVEEVDVTALVYNCSIDPGSDDPADVDECDPADAVDVTAAENGGGSTTLPTTAGSVTFSATVGSTLTVSIAVPDGYQPIGNGSQTFTVSDATTIVFVNVAEDGQGDPQLGRLQLILGGCPSTEPRDPKFVVVPPTSLRAAATPECGPTPFGNLTITGGSLGANGLQATTDANGNWQGYLPAGNYTVSVASGSKDGVPVVADELTAVVVIEYSVPATGSLTVTRTVCYVGDTEETNIEVSNDELPTGGDGCGLANGQFNLTDLSNQRSIDFSLGNDGVATQSLPAGTYQLTDLASGQSATVNITEGAGVYAAVRTVSLYGTLVVRHYLCDDAEATDADPSDDGYFELNCRQGNGGVAITLFDEDGNAVDTATGSGTGVVTWNQIVPGNYSVETAKGLCAAFVDGADARDGFSVAAGSTTFVKVYTCAASNGGNNGGDDDDDDDDGGNNNGGGNNGGDDDSDDDGGNNTGGNSNHDNDTTDDAHEVANVNTLPNTGIMTSQNGHSSMFGLLALGALSSLLAAAALARRKAN